MAEHGDSGGGGEVVDHSENRGGPMSVKEADQTAAEPIRIEGAEITSGGNGGKGYEQETAGVEESRAVNGKPRTTDQAGAVGPRVDPAGPSSMVESLSVIRGSGNVVGSGGARGDDFGPSGSPPRDLTKGEGLAVEEEHVEEEQTTEVAPSEIREEDIVFRPPVTAAIASRHVLITLDDVAEHTPDEILTKLLEDNPIIGEYVLKAKEDRAMAIEASEAAAPAERERAGPEGLVEDMEVEEREAEEEQGPRVRAVDEAGAMTCPEFSEKTYVPPRPHLFVPSGFSGYKPPQQTDYDIELVLRDPRVHIANTWAKAEHRDIHSFGGPCSSLAVYEGFPERVRRLVDAAGFGEYIRPY
ncbi:hypothetical protein RHMOL_Rhmol04G0185400 [Rhododendron molle]|uniref:Uncharacterized protein n=1 Tax=Rhododendron molle TaxID=49168 RepID=A0ACC0P1U8_RHOML|nr:hypothetical protein RHMOL_Rhmol04G0185400 [Rhododendron molle]